VSRFARAIVLAAAALSIGCYIGASLLVWAMTGPDAAHRFASVGLAARLGPATQQRGEHVAAALQSAIGSLDRSRAGAGPYGAEFGERIREARAILRRGLTVAPLDAKGIEQLAAVNWEISAFNGVVDDDVRLILLAATRSPRQAELQFDVGSLLLRLAHTDDALRYLDVAVNLDAGLSDKVVAALHDQSLAPEEILRSIPGVPAIAIALRSGFLERDEADAYLAELERLFRDHPAELMRFYENTAFITGRSERALAFLGSVDLHARPALEAEKRFATAHARLALGRAREALNEIDAALLAKPDVPEFTELRADCLLQLGRASEAAASYKDAIHQAVAANWSAAVRARLYHSLASAYRADSRGDLAYDSLRRALDLAPDDSAIRAEMDSVSGRALGKSGDR
jgi:tetratricopeptide (TPR) repeat protein